MVVEFPSVIQVLAIDVGGYTVALIIIVLLFYRMQSFRSNAEFIFHYIVLVFRSVTKLGPKKTLQIFLSVVINDAAAQRSSFETYRAKLIHLCIFWGFAGLAVTTSLDAIVNHAGEPLPLFHPVRMLGNISGAVIMIGLSLALFRRLLSKSLRERTSNYDLIFFLLLYTTSITGFVTEFTSMADLYVPTYVIYFSHMILVASLLLTAPFTKFVHSLKLPILILFYRFRHALIERGVLMEWEPIGGLNEKLLSA